MIGHRVWRAADAGGGEGVVEEADVGRRRRASRPHAVIGGEPDDEAGVESAAERRVDRGIERVGQGVAGGGGVLDEIGQRGVDERLTSRVAIASARSIVYGDSRQS